MTQFSKWKTIGYAAAIFVAGGISGGALGVYETRSQLSVPVRQQEMVQHLRNRLKARLGLSPDQMEKITPIIEGAAAQIRSIRLETFQRVNKVFDDSYAQISAVLTPEQRTKLDKMQRERREMMQMRLQEARRRNGGDGGGPGAGGPPGSPGQ